MQILALEYVRKVLDLLIKSLLVPFRLGWCLSPRLRAGLFDHPRRLAGRHWVVEGVSVVMQAYISRFPVPFLDGFQAGLAKFLRLCAVAVCGNSSRTPDGRRSRSRPSCRMRLRCGEQPLDLLALAPVL